MIQSKKYCDFVTASSLIFSTCVILLYIIIHKVHGYSVEPVKLQSVHSGAANARE